MVDEITLTYLLNVTNNDVVLVDREVRKLLADQTAGRVYAQVHNVTTAGISIASFGDVTTPGACWMQNLDGTNRVKWGFTAAYGASMGANDGDTAKGMPVASFYGDTGMSLFLQAQVANCDVLVVVADQ